jgi:hypothetical protein
MDKGVLENYQILTPSTWMASPKDPFGNPGPYEEAVHATPLLENFEKPEDYKGIDILRTIRSFDPCMPCTTHIHTENRVISREVVTCACGVDDEHEHAFEHDDVDVYVPHQANTRIIDYAARKLGIPEDRVVVNVDRYGNTSSGSIPLALADAEAEGRLTAGSTVLMTGMGAGLTWGSALMEWTANGRVQ